MSRRLVVAGRIGPRLPEHHKSVYRYMELWVADPVGFVLRGRQVLVEGLQYPRETTSLVMEGMFRQAAAIIKEEWK